jgi:hypothetical protein
MFGFILKISASASDTDEPSLNQGLHILRLCP